MTRKDTIGLDSDGARVKLSEDELQMLIEVLEDGMNDGSANPEYHLPLHESLFNAYDLLRQYKAMYGCEEDSL